MAAVETEKNRWLIAASAMAIHLSIGSVYAYSVYQLPLQRSLGWSLADVTLGFTVAIFTLGMASAFLGRYVERFGPRLSGGAAALLFGCGTISSGVAVQLGSYPGFLLAFGVIGGIGLGVGYITPVSTLVSWFPDRRGLATGLAVMGFGTGALVSGPLADALMDVTSIPVTFTVLGTGYLATIAAGASYLEKPPDGWVPAGMSPSEVGEGAIVRADLEQRTARQAIRTPQFYLVWLVMFVNISAGIMLLSVASNMTQAITGATPTVAAAVVGLLGVFNGAGRIVWSSLSDYLGRTSTYGLLFAIQLLAFLALPTLTAVWVFAGGLFLIITCYGGGFACLPAYLADLFGTGELGAIHGRTLTAWSLAGIAGPTLVSQVVSRTGSYEPAFYLVAALMLVGLGCVGLLRWRIDEVRRATLDGTPHGRAY